MSRASTEPFWGNQCPGYRAASVERTCAKVTRHNTGLGGTRPRRRVYEIPMNDTQIVELDEPEPAAAPRPWRAGSLTLFAVPVLLAAAATLILTARTETRPTLTGSPTPTTAPRPAATLQLIAII